MPERTTDDNVSHDDELRSLSAMFNDVGVGRMLGDRYRLVAPVGSGSSARVYLAEDLSLGRRVAVKCLRAGLTGDYRFLRRFRAEAKAAAQLSHPNILAVHDWGEDASAAYLVTEVLLGGTLRDMIEGSPRLSPSQGLLVALQVAQGLSYAHELGWVHRDVKPANLLFGKDGRLRIADFGIARALAEATWTEPEGVLVGTARYAAPEQASSVGISGRTDVYSLALTIVEAVTGRVPLLADNALATMMLRQDRDLDPLPELGPLGEVLVEAGRADPDRRPTATELIDLLLRAARRLPRPGPLPLVELRPPVRPDGMALIDLRTVRDDPDPTGPPAHGLAAPRLTAAQLARARMSVARLAAADGGAAMAPPSGLDHGTIRSRPRPVPLRLTPMPADTDGIGVRPDVGSGSGSGVDEPAEREPVSPAAVAAPADGAPPAARSDRSNPPTSLLGPRSVAPSPAWVPSMRPVLQPAEAPPDVEPDAEQKRWRRSRRRNRPAAAPPDGRV